MPRKKQASKKRSLKIEHLDNRVMLDGAGFIDLVFFGPTPYLSEADVPEGFLPDSDCEECVSSLETFEDDSLDFGLELSDGMIIGPGFSTGTQNLTDSVDSDDGIIDGTGQSNNLGYSYFSQQNSITVTLPSLMQSAGLVWTDGAAGVTDVIFEAFDENGDSLGTFNAGPIANNDIMGSTDDDHFFGVSYGDGVTTGVTSITITNVGGGGGIEIDHIQFANCSACCDEIDLEIEKTVDAEFVNAGDTVTWTVTVTNNEANANTAATGVTITDLFPAGLTFTGASATGGSFDGTTWTLVDPLAPGESQTLTITSTIDAGLAGGTMLTNTAHVATANETDVDSTPGDSNVAEDDADDAKVTVNSFIDLELNKTVDNPIVQDGGLVTWTISLTNNALTGNAAATGVTVIDAIPPGLGFVSASATSGSFDISSETWTLGGPVGLGDTETLTLVTINDSGFGGGTTLVNVAHVATANETDIDSTPGDEDVAEDDADDAAVTIGRVIDLELDKTVDSSIVQGGDTVTWTISLTNNNATANAVATGVTVADVLPAGLSLVNASATSGSFAGGIWTLGGPVSDTEILTLVTTIDDGLAGGTMLVNTAYVATANETDVDSAPGDATLTEDDADDAKVTIGNVIDLELTKTVDSSVVQTGDTVNWTITLTNNAATANADATGVVVQDVLPAGVTFVNATTTGDSQFAAGQWIINEAISPGETLTLVLETTVTAAFDGAIVNTAQVVDADQTDIDSSPNNSAGEDDESAAQIVVNNPVVSSLSLSGHSYVDTNNDGIFQSFELPLLGVEITLMGTDNLGNAVNLTTFTNSDGFYQFDGLAAGTYMVTQTQPVQFLDGRDTLGNLGGNGSVNDKFTVTLTSDAVEYNFGELGLLPQFVNKRLYLTSTPYTEWNYVDVRQTSIWYSFDADHRSFLEANATLPAGGNATMTIFDGNMNVVASQTLGLVVDPVELPEGGTYYVRISGDTVIQTLSLDIVSAPVVDPAAPSANVTVNGNQLIAVGTAGDDEISLYLGLQEHVLEINGETMRFDATVVTDIHLGASTGNDTVTVVATHLDDTASVIETFGELHSSHYSVHTYAFDNTIFVSGGGNDHSQLYGSYGDDTLSALPDDTTLTTPDGVAQMLGFDRVDTYGRGGNDYAALYGTQGDDWYIARDEYTVLTGENFMAYTKDFERVDAFGRGGNDIAALHDSAGDDRFISTDVFASMQTSTRLTYTKDFEEVTALSLNGGNDSAYVLNLTADDHVQAAGSEANFTRNAARTESIHAFDHVMAFYDVLGATDIDDEDLDFFLDITT